MSLENVSENIWVKEERPSNMRFYLDDFDCPHFV